MRVDVKKILFIGLEKEKKTFFQKAQELGVVHFIGVKTKELPEELSHLVQALKILRSLDPVKQIELQEWALVDPLVFKIEALKEQLHQEDEALSLAKQEMLKRAPFGHFDLEELSSFGFIVQFFTSKIRPDHEGLIYITTREGLHYFVSLRKIPLVDDKLTEVKIEKSIDLDALQKARHATEEKLKKYAKYNAFLHKALFEKLNWHHLEKSEESVQVPLQAIFSVEGYIPLNKLKSIEGLAESLSISMQEVAIEGEERVPTYLENKGWSKVGEDLVHIYDVPSTADKDPSLWVLIAFGIFFAFVVGDAGYGSVYLGFCLYMWWRYPHLKGAKQRVLALATLLAVLCIIWGLMANSFFGLKVSDNYSLVGWLQRQKGAASSDPILLELALFIGAIHVLIGMARYVKRNPSLWGWMLFIVGGFLYFPTYLDTSSLLNYVFKLPVERSATVGLYLMGIGVIMALGIAIYKYRLVGLTELMNVIQVFSDILSYLRLYALALAGGILTSVINEAAAALPLVLGVLLMIVAHLGNMALGVMGGVIHGLRLNFLEWYHYSFEGGGTPFKPLMIYRKEDV